jgi:hypothetical protein
MNNARSSSSSHTRSLTELSSSLAEVEKSLQEVCEKHYSRHLSAASSLRDALQSVTAAAIAADDAATSCSEVVAYLTPGPSAPSFSELASEHSGLRKLLLAASGGGNGGDSADENSGGATVALELLDMPSLMSNCVRIALSGGMGGTSSSSAAASNSNAVNSSQTIAFNAAEDALDILEFASSLFVSQKLWRSGSAPQQQTASKRHSSLLRELVWSTRAAGRELEEGLVSLLSTKPPLQVVLRVSSILKRIRAQQALARSKIATDFSQASSTANGPQPPSALAASAAQLAIDELQDSLFIRAAFLGGRDESLQRDMSTSSSTLLTSSLALSSRSPQNSSSGSHHIALRAIDAHRSTLLESATHFAAIVNSMNPSGSLSTTSALLPLLSPPLALKGEEAVTLTSFSAALEISSRLLFSNFVSSVSQATLTAIVLSTFSIDDGMAASAIAQQAAYAVRRGGRFASADGIQLGVALLAPKLAEGCALALDTSRRNFSHSLHELCQSAGSYSEVGLSGNVASIFATLSNDTALAVNALRGFWHRDISHILSMALQHHADQVVVIAEESLGTAPGSGLSINVLIDSSIKEMASFVSVCQSIAILL